MNIIERKSLLSRIELELKNDCYKIFPLSKSIWNDAKRYEKYLTDPKKRLPRAWNQSKTDRAKQYCNLCDVVNQLCQRRGETCDLEQIFDNHKAAKLVVFLFCSMNGGQEPEVESCLVLHQSKETDKMEILIFLEAISELSTRLILSYAIVYSAWKYGGRNRISIFSEPGRNCLRSLGFKKQRNPNSMEYSTLFKEYILCVDECVLNTIANALPSSTAINAAVRPPCNEGRDRSVKLLLQPDQKNLQASVESML